MAYLTDKVPYFRCLVRREYTRNLKDRHGEYIPAIAYGVRCVRGQSLWFQCMLLEPVDGSPNNTGGASFLLPIEALCHKPCAKPDDMTYTQPWDVFAENFGVCAFDFLSAAYVLPAKIPAQYVMSFDFTGSDLADDSEQHKHLHLCFLENGLIGSFPNNRLLFRDDAIWQLMDQPPDFTSLAGEFYAEGMPPALHKPNGATPLNGVHTNPNERADWLQEITTMAESAPVTHYAGAKKKPAAKKPASKAKKPTAKKPAPKARVRYGY